MEVGDDEDTERRAISNQLNFYIVLLSALKCQHHCFTSEDLLWEHKVKKLNN